MNVPPPSFNQYTASQSDATRQKASNKSPPHQPQPLMSLMSAPVQPTMANVAGGCGAAKPPPLMSLATKFSPMPATMPIQQLHSDYKHIHDDDAPIEEHATKRRNLEAAYNEFKALVMQDLAISMI